MVDALARRVGPDERVLVAAAYGAVSVTMRGAMARFVFRGDANAAAACGKAFGAPLPEAACRAEVAGARAALWLGPDEWLLLAPEADGAALAVDLPRTLGGMPHSLVDVSHRQVALEIAGPRAADLLASHCMLDLDGAAFPVGMCTRTLFAKAEIVLWHRAADRFHVEVWRSFAPYLEGMLRAAAMDLD